MRRLRSWFSSEWTRIAGLRGRAARDERTDAEFRFHLEMLIARNERSGMSSDEARRAAHVQFGGVDRFMEHARDEHRSRPLEDLGRDTRRAVRNLVRVPAFTTAAIVTLGLGIGATTVMYSIVDHVVLRPLPYPAADRLALVRVVAQELRDQVPSLAANSVRFLEWRERCALCEDVGAVRATALTWSGAGDPVRLDGLRVSSNLLPLLGARAQHGRLFREEEELAGATGVVVLSDAFWQREFAGDPAAIGRTIVLNDAPRVIVGVLQPGFRLPKRDELGARTELPDDPQLYVPLTFAEWELRGQGGFDYSVIARLGPGVTPAAAQAHLDELESAITARYGAGLTISSLVMPLHDQVVGGSRRGLVLLLGAVAAVLLLVCVNLASLLLARNAGRAREAAVRVALGAGRGRLIRESLTESLVLALAAGVVGLVLAQVGLTALLQLAPSDLPRLHEVRFDGRIAAAGVMLSLLTGLLFGILPALRTGGADPSEALKSGGRTQSQGRATARARMSLIAAQVALTAILLVTAGLFLSSFARVLGVDRGFRAERALALDVVLPRSYGDGTGSERAYGELLERMRRIPGVAAAAATSRLPLDGLLWADGMSAENDPRPSEEQPLGNFHFVTPDYFATLDIPLRGTAFTLLDHGRSVVVLSAHAAALIFPDGTDPIGRRVQLGSRVLAEVVGVAADVAATGIGTEPDPIVYLPPWTPLGFSPASSVVLRTEVDPRTLTAAARGAVREAGAGIAIARVRTLDQMVDEATAARRFQLSLLLLFAVTALVTACVGIYGVVAHSLASRRSEIGVRMALGAHRSDIHRLVVRQGVAAAATGLVAGFAVVVALGRLVQSLLFGVRAADPAVLAAVATLLAVVTAAASWIPARRATARDLALTLRD